MSSDSVYNLLAGQRQQFGRIPGDKATWTTGDPGAAVRLCKAAPYVALDIETGSAVSASRWSVKAVTVSDTAQSHVLHPGQHRDAIIECIRSAQVLVLHNSQYDIPILVQAGLMRLQDISKVRDTLVSARLAWPGGGVMFKNDLGAVADRVLGGEGSYSLQKNLLKDGWKKVMPRMRTGDMWDHLSLDHSSAYAAYAAYDVVLTARVYAALPGAMSDAMNPGLPGFEPADSRRLDDREQAVNRLMLRSSARGILVDDDAMQEIEDEIDWQVSEARQIILDNGYDPDSDIRKRIVLRMQEEGTLPASWPILKNGTPSTAKHLMERLESHPAVQAELVMSKSARWRKDYGQKVQHMTRNGRIHPQVNILAARTGRSSYSDPPLQQYPPAVRKMFMFEQPITSLDWSSIEPVVFANLTGESGMYEPFEAGGDIYEPIGSTAGTSRKQAKVVLLAALYGQSTTELALSLDTSIDDALRIKRAVRKAAPRIYEGIGMITAYGNQYGWVQTISGRPVPIDPVPSTGNKEYYGYRGVNYVIQGSAYDILAEALYTAEKDGLGDSVHLAVHDEIVCDTVVASEMERIMTTAPADLIRHSGRTPLLRVGRADLGRNWCEK